MNYRIDNLQYCNWSRKIFEINREAQLDAIHVTIVYHEDYDELLLQIKKWDDLFKENSDLIFLGNSFEDIKKARAILKFSPKEAARRLEKLLLSAIANWQAKNESDDVEKANLFIKEIKVDSAGMIKRIRPAPQGRAHRIRKRSNHVTLVLGNNKIN